MNITTIIENEQIKMKYQPIMSTHNKGFLGLEALVRGWINNEEISPFHLFEQAKLKNQVLMLDKLCIRKSIEGFRDFYQFNKRTLLFINIDAAVLDYYIENDYIEALICLNGIRHENIVLEINELRSSSLDKMKEFSKKYKKLGCLIALDDIGAGESNLNRIPLIMPDIMKIDKEIIKDLKDSFYSKQVVARIVEMATNLGALIVIEGVETSEELFQIASFGANLIQGYFLGKPGILDKAFYLSILENKSRIIELIYEYNDRINHGRKLLHDNMNDVGEKIKARLESVNSKVFERVILEEIYRYDEVESVYVLDEHGKLMTDTVFNQRMTIDYDNPLYTPCVEGESVELEEYFTRIKYGGYAFWISNEYISMASGNKCYTYSSSFVEGVGRRSIVCIDFNSKMMNDKLMGYKEVVKYA